jgi:hypothetical protein
VSYSITRRQTTYWDLSQAAAVTRIHFVGKEEFSFVHPVMPSFAVVQDHPVLLDYQFAWERIFVASACAAPQRVLHRLAQAMAALLQGWRGATAYLNSAYDPVAVLRGGSGLLLSAPRPIARIACDVLTAEGLQFTELPARGLRWPREALVAGKNFVVAHSFRIEQLM